MKSTCRKYMIVLCMSVVSFIAVSVHVVRAGDYLSSAHGDSVIGVNRTDMETQGYARGNCTHCHESHASIGGVENDPVGTNRNYVLFYDNFDPLLNVQTDGICFQCHTKSNPQQAGGITNYGYSDKYGGGGATTCPDTIQEAFSYVNDGGSSVSNCGSDWGSAHGLKDMVAYIDGKNGYTATSTPCVACHNPHAAQANWPVSRFSEHNNTPWPIYGDQSLTDRMDQYPTYQPPFSQAETLYEPDDNPVSTPVDTVNYIAFCTDCHIDLTTPPVPSTALGRDTLPINWLTEKHGEASADDEITMNLPYGSLGAVMNCTDCHEPHGSPNKVLIRDRVNGADLLGADISATVYGSECTPLPPSPADTNKTMGALCDRCHRDDNDDNGSCPENTWYSIHHVDGAGEAAPYAATNPCTNCHNTGNPASANCSAAVSAINCNCCHFHGSSAAGRVTF